MTLDPQDFHDTPADSGYSVDNLAPAVPQNFHLENPSLLMWDASPEEDLDYYTVYGSEIEMLDSTAVTIGTTSDTTMTIEGDHAAQRIALGRLVLARGTRRLVVQGG